MKINKRNHKKALTDCAITDMNGTAQIIADADNFQYFCSRAIEAIRQAQLATDCDQYLIQAICILGFARLKNLEDANAAEYESAIRQRDRISRGLS